MLKVSVLMSVYKSEKAAHLYQALKSVWDDQTLKPAQIVLIEDGELGQDLYEVIEQYKKVLGEQLCVCKNATNVGLTKSLNIGLQHVTSELVARMDSDDVSDAKRFERQVTYLIEHPDVDIIGGSLQEFDEDHECLNVRHYPLTPEEAVKYIPKASPLAHPSVMMRTRMFENGLRYDERYRTSQDIQLWFDAIMAGYKIGNVPEVVLYFRREGDVFKRRSKAKAKNEFKIYMHGIYRMKGLFTLWMVKKIYGSNLRNRVLQKK